MLLKAYVSFNVVHCIIRELIDKRQIKTISISHWTNGVPRVSLTVYNKVSFVERHINILSDNT